MPAALFVTGTVSPQAEAVEKGDRHLECEKDVLPGEHSGRHAGPVDAATSADVFAATSPLAGHALPVVSGSEVAALALARPQDAYGAFLKEDPRSWVHRLYDRPGDPDNRDRPGPCDDAPEGGESGGGESGGGETGGGETGGGETGGGETGGGETGGGETGGGETGGGETGDDDEGGQGQGGQGQGQGQGGQGQGGQGQGGGRGRG
jgi:hypothetical protein